MHLMIFVLVAFSLASAQGAGSNRIYLGCYQDQNVPRDLDGKFTVLANNSIETCEAVCSNYRYFGLQYTNQCFCGNTYGRYGRISEASCSWPCPGNAGQMCGASFISNIYINKLFTDSSSFPYGGKYIGCFGDNSTRDLTGYYSKSNDKNTIEGCIKQCWDNYYKFAGLQYGSECFCDNSYGTYGNSIESDCSYNCTGNSKQTCGGFWRNSIYELNVRPNPCNPSPCSGDAVCTSTSDGQALCSCPVGKTPNGRGGCCKALSCWCWGDPHCSTFDRAPYHFMGRCKYEFISTNCTNSTLPNGMVPFNVYIKQENRAGVPNANNVAFLRYIEINVFGHQYRLLKAVNNVIQFSVDGVLTRLPFFDNINKISAVPSGGKLYFNTEFGLTIAWDGISYNTRTDVSLCDSYAKYVCGLCGNADGNAANDFVDRLNKPVPLIGTDFTKHFNWGSSYRVYDDSVDAVDINQSTCNPSNPPGTISGPNCTGTYTGKNWCGAINDTTGVWTKCLNKMSPDVVSGIYVGCLFDVCSFESNGTAKAQLCSTLQKFNDECISLGASLNLTWSFNWRSQYGCNVTCGKNEVYETRAECPKTCANPLGDYNCGAVKPYEACYCKDGFVTSSNGTCIDVRECAVLPTEKCHEQVQKCYIYGDPNYTSLNGSAFSISDDCTYLIASDSCNPVDGNIYQIYAVHEHRSDDPNEEWFLGKVIIKLGLDVYELDTNLKVNGQWKSVPYTTNDVKVFYQYNVLIFQSDYFILGYDGVNWLKLSKCFTNTFCGLCGVQLSGQSEISHPPDIKAFLLNDPDKAECRTNNVFPSMIPIK